MENIVIQTAPQAGLKKGTVISSGIALQATDKLGIYNDLALFNPGPLT